MSGTVMNLASLLLLGFFLGMRHATDADHVIAIATIVSRQRSLRGSALIGAAWGVGHTLTLMLFGGAVFVLGHSISPSTEQALETAVGVMLIVLGAANLRDLIRLFRHAPGAPHPEVHSHAHAHGDYVHTHAHGHAPERHPHEPERTPVSWLDRHLGGMTLYRLLRPLIVGIVHGLAGSAAVALLVLAAISEPRWALLYLVLFGAGTIVGMMIVTAAIALPFRYAGMRSGFFAARLRVAAGMVSLLFGTFLVYRISIVQGLFSNAVLP